MVPERDGSATEGTVVTVSYSWLPWPEEVELSRWVKMLHTCAPRICAAAPTTSVHTVIRGPT